MNSSLEKEVTVGKRELEEALGERALLGEEAEQLKLVLKRELDRMEAELRTKDAIISDYKNITQILQGKLDTLSGKGEREEQGQGDIGPMDGAVERIRELELELAQTKLALVETECKNQALRISSQLPRISREPLMGLNLTLGC